jgi:MFS family permease
MIQLSSHRRARLERNFRKIFWIRALTSIKVINIVMSIFLLHRGLQLHQLFYLAIVWGATTLIFEMPSSYLADRWGRKKTIIIGTVASLMYWMFYLMAHDFLFFALGTMWYAISVAMFSGTDQALIYDTAKELGREKDSLSKLGQYFSSRHLIKIVTPIIAVFIASELSEIQFVTLILVDIVATIAALLLTFTLTEANHYMDVEKTEAGVMRDAFSLLKSSRPLRVAILNRVLLFVGFLIVWHYYHAFYVDLGVPLLFLGIGWGLCHLMIYLFYTHVHSIVPNHHLTRVIDLANLAATSMIILLVLLFFIAPNPYVLYILFILFTFFEAMRLPLIFEFLNKLSHSYNRATTISLASLMKSVLEIPVALVAAFAVTYHIISPYILTLILGLIVLTFFRMSEFRAGVK